MTVRLGSSDVHVEPSRINHLLNAVENASPVAAVDAVAEELLVSVEALQVSFFIADFSGEQLVRLAQRGAAEANVGPEAEIQPIENSTAGSALRRQEVQIIEREEVTSVYVPVTARGETIGVLEVVLRKPPTPQIIAELRAVAHALAYIIIVNGRHTDLFEWGQRSVPMTLAAEIQRRLIPDAFTCEAGQFTLAGWLEPSSQVAGDTFDYSLERDELSISVTDAVGHSVGAALIAAVCVSALRNARRSGQGLEARAGAANSALLQHAENDQFVTGQLISVDLPSQTAAIVNAGHPPPYLFRDGKVTLVKLDADPPFGMFETTYRVQELNLVEGDRLLLVTDGLIERNAANIDIAPIIRNLAASHPREVVQHLCQRVAKEAGGTLNDDATVVCLDWHGGPDRSRKTDAGANEFGASD